MAGSCPECTSDMVTINPIPERKDMSEITIRWIDDKMMAGTDSNGHSIIIGRSPDPKFKWVGIKPSELLLMAAGACSGYDVVEILSKQREPFTDIKIICTGSQVSDPPYQFTDIHLHYIVHGNINKTKLERAIQLSEEKYCSVIATLKPTVKISSDYEIINLE